MTENKWHTGYPKDIGLYSCKVNGKEKTLSHKYCELNGKHRWATLQGGDVIGEVFWQKKVTDPEEIK